MPGAEARETCCGHAAVFSPTSLTLIDSGAAHAICLECWHGTPEGLETRWAPGVEEDFDELGLDVEASRAILARMNWERLSDGQDAPD